MRILLDGISTSSKSEMTLDKLTKDFKWECRSSNSAQRNEAGSDSSEITENAQQRYERYATSNLSEVSDPAEWLDMRGQSANDDDDQML